MSNDRIHPKHSKTPRRARWYDLWPVWALCAGFSLLLLFILAREYIADLPRKSDIKVVAAGEGRDLHLDKATLSSRQLRLFEMSASGTKERVVVERTDETTIHVALASCRTCYRSRARHYAQRGQMMCGECNMLMNFESKDHKASTKSCALVEIPHTETSGNITVLASDVLALAAKQPQ